MHIAAITLPCLALLTGLSSVSAKKAPGPSGRLLTPAGGTVIQTAPFDGVTGGGLGRIDFNYDPVYKWETKDCASLDCAIQTLYVDVTLRDTAGNKTKLASYLSSSDPLTNIQASLAIPPKKCGEFDLVVREYQLASGKPYNFKAAAPKITIQCSDTTVAPVVA